MYIIAVLMYTLTYNATPEDGEERWVTVFNVNEYISFFINNQIRQQQQEAQNYKQQLKRVFIHSYRVFVAWITV